MDIIGDKAFKAQVSSSLLEYWLRFKLAGFWTTDMVRVALPGVLPPTFRGTAVRYLYYITAAMRWTRCAAENGHGPSPPPTSTSELLVSISSFSWVLIQLTSLNASSLFQSLLSLNLQSFKYDLFWFLYC